MGFVESLKSAYFSVEDKYYALADALKERGVPVYNYFIDPIENRGVPSFPFAVLLVLLVFAGVFSLVAGQTATLLVSVSADQGSVEGIPVTLVLDGDRPRTALVENGVATFEGVPVGRSGRLLVSATGFEPLEQPIQVERDRQLSVSLTASKAPEVTLLVKVLSDDGKAVPGAQIFFASEGQDGSVVTDASGFANVPAASESAVVNLEVSKNGFETRKQKAFASLQTYQITLTPLKQSPPPVQKEWNQQESKGSVLANVRDASNNPVPALVTLYNVELSSPIKSDQTDGRGTVFFRDAAAVGTFVYIDVKPLDAARYADYNGFADARELLLYADVAFDVVLRAKAPGDTGPLELTVTDQAGAPVANADVGLYLSNSERRIDFTTTDFNGKASFEVARGESYYLTAYAPGYLPGALHALRIGDAKTIQLRRAIAGNNAELDVEVLTSDGDRAASASVELWYADAVTGAATGIPLQTTTAGGVAGFTGLPLNVPFRAKAVLGSATGLSDSFVVQLGQEPTSVTVRLGPTFGTLQVTVLDATNNRGIAGATTRVQYEGAAPPGPAPTCTTDANGKCQLEAVANRPLSLRLSAAGYADQTTTTFTLSTRQTVQKTYSLLPASLANDLRVVSVRVYDTRNQEVTDALERGTPYFAEVAVNLPMGSDKAGVFVRAGERASAAEDIVYFTGFQALPEAGLLNPSVTQGATYRPGSSCAAETLASDNKIKWMQVEYAEPAGGATQTLAFRFTVDAAAKDTDRVALFYRAYAQRGNAVTRDPADPTLGSAVSAPGKDSCYADATRKDFRVAQGRGVCNDRACIYLGFAEDATQAPQTAFTATLSQNFASFIGVKSFVPLQNPYLRISIPKQEISLHQFTLTQPSGASSGDVGGAFERRFNLNIGQGDAADAVITSRPVFPSANARVRLEFGDARGVIQSLDGYVSIEGTGTLVLHVSPSTIQANQRTNVRVRVTTAAGAPVTDATVYLDEGPENPFNGQGVRGSPIRGNGGENTGENGEYAFRSVQPVFTGTLLVRAKRDGFRTQTADVDVVADDFLRFEPSEDLGLQFSGGQCTQSQRITVRNLMNVQVTINALVQPAGCLQLSGQGVVCTGSVCSFIVPATRDPARPSARFLNVLPTDFSQRLCTIEFASSLPFGGGTSSASYPVDLSCVAATPTPGPQVPQPPGVLLCRGDRDCGDYASSGTCVRKSCVADGTAEQACYSWEGTCQQNGECSLGVCNCQDMVFNYYVEKFADDFFRYYLLTGITVSLQKTPVVADAALGGVRVTLAQTPQVQQPSGGAKLTLTPVTPSDAFALTIENRGNSAVTPLTKATLNNVDATNCFAVEDITESGGESFASKFFIPSWFAWVRERGQDARGLGAIGSIPAGQLKTYRVSYKPTAACLNYAQTTNGMELRFPPGNDAQPRTYTVEVGAAGVGTQSFNVVVSINNANAPYAVMSSPWFGFADVVTRSPNAIEPVAITKNTPPSLGFEVRDAVPPLGSTEQTKERYYVISRASPSPSPLPDAFKSLGALDVVANVKLNPARYTDCTYHFCTPSESVIQRLTTDLSAVAKGLSDIRAKNQVKASDVKEGNLLRDSFIAALYDTAFEFCNDSQALFCYSDNTYVRRMAGYRLGPAWAPSGGYNPFSQPNPYGGQYNYPQDPRLVYGGGQFGGQNYGGQYAAYGGGGPYGSGQYGHAASCNIEAALYALCDMLRSKNRFQSRSSSGRILPVLTSSFGAAICQANIIAILAQGYRDQVPRGQFYPGVAAGGGIVNQYLTRVSDAAHQNLQRALSGQDLARYRDSDVSKPVLEAGELLVTVPMRVAGEDGGIKILKFNLAGESAALTREGRGLLATQLYILPPGTSTTPAKGYPYVQCTQAQGPATSAGAVPTACEIKFDDGTPALATLNKYKVEAEGDKNKKPLDALSVAEFFSASSTVTGNAVRVTSCLDSKGALANCADAKPPGVTFSSADGYWAVRLDRGAKRLFVYARETPIPVPTKPSVAYDLSQALSYLASESAVPEDKPRACGDVHYVSIGGSVEYLYASCPGLSFAEMPIKSACRVVSDQNTNSLDLADGVAHFNVLVTLDDGTEFPLTGDMLAAFESASAAYPAAAAVLPSGDSIAWGIAGTAPAQPSTLLVNVKSGPRSAQCTATVLAAPPSPAPGQPVFAPAVPESAPKTMADFGVSVQRDTMKEKATTADGEKRSEGLVVSATAQTAGQPSGKILLGARVHVRDALKAPVRPWKWYRVVALKLPASSFTIDLVKVLNDEGYADSIPGDLVYDFDYEFDADDDSPSGYYNYQAWLCDDGWAPAVPGHNQKIVEAIKAGKDVEAEVREHCAVASLCASNDYNCLDFEK